jgi:hypothetical protein
MRGEFRISRGPRSSCGPEVIAFLTWNQIRDSILRSLLRFDSADISTTHSVVRAATLILRQLEWHGLDPTEVVPTMVAGRPEDFPNKRLLFSGEGGGVYVAERNGRFYLITDESAMADFLDEDDETPQTTRIRVFTTLAARMEFPGFSGRPFGEVCDPLRIARG